MGYEYAIQTPYTLCTYPFMPSNASVPSRCDQTFADVDISEYRALRGIAVTWTLALLVYAILEFTGAVLLSVNQARWRGERATFAARLRYTLSSSYKSMSKVVLIVLLMINLVRAVDIRGSGGAVPAVLSLVLDELANAVTIVICSLYSLSVSVAVGRTLRIGAPSHGRYISRPVINATLLVVIPVVYIVLALCDGITGVGHATFFLARSVLMGGYAISMGISLTLSTGRQWVRIVHPRSRAPAPSSTTDPHLTAATIPVSPVARAAASYVASFPTAAPPDPELLRREGTRGESHVVLLGGGEEQRGSSERPGGSHPEMRVTATSGAYSSTSLGADAHLLSERSGGAGVYSAGAVATAAMDSTGIMSTGGSIGGTDAAVATPSCSNTAPQLSEPGEALGPTGDAVVTGPPLEEPECAGISPENSQEGDAESTAFRERSGARSSNSPAGRAVSALRPLPSGAMRAGTAHSLPTSEAPETSRSLVRSQSQLSMTPDDSAHLHRSANLRDGGVSGVLIGYMLVAGFNNLILIAVGIYALVFAASNMTATYSPTLTINSGRPLAMYFEPAGVFITVFVLPPWFLGIVSSCTAAAYCPRLIYLTLSGRLRAGRKHAWPGRRRQRIVPAGMHIDVDSGDRAGGAHAGVALSPRPLPGAVFAASRQSPRLPPIASATSSPRQVSEQLPRSPSRGRPPPLLESKAPTVNRNPTVRGGPRPGGVGVVVSDALTTIAEAGPLEEEGAHEAEEVSGPEEEGAATARAFDFAAPGMR